MNEKTLVDKLVKDETAAMPGCVIIKHFDTVTVGIPDLSTTWAGLTLWQECKFGENYEVSDTQERMMSRLARAGMSYFIIFLPGRTLVCTGLQITYVLASFDKHDTKGVSQFLKQEAVNVHSSLRQVIRPGVRA